LDTTCRLVAGFAVATLQLLRLEVSRSAELPVRVGISVDAAPGLTCGQACEAYIQPGSPRPPRSFTFTDNHLRATPAGCQAPRTYCTGRRAGRPETDRLSNTPAAKSGLQVSAAAGCCRSTVRNGCVTEQVVGGLCDGA